MQQDKLPTDQGLQTIPEIFSALMYSSYEANRGLGMSHEALVRIGVGDDACRIKYESNNN